MRGCKVWVVLFFPSNDVVFIGGISLLHGDIDTLIRFSPYVFVLKEQTSPCWRVFLTLKPFGINLNSYTNLRIICVVSGHLSWAEEFRE